MDHYKSWAGLHQWLRGCLCGELKDSITYFLTRYHKVHNAYGRAAILLDGRELVCFSWIEQYRQEQMVAAKYAEDTSQNYLGLYDALKPVWDENAAYCEMDFLQAVLAFRQLSIQDALASEDSIVRILAILDRRVGKRTLQKIAQAGEYRQYPVWVRRFYELRIEKEFGA